MSFGSTFGAAAAAAALLYGRRRFRTPARRRCRRQSARRSTSSRQPSPRPRRSPCPEDGLPPPILPAPDMPIEDPGRRTAAGGRAGRRPSAPPGLPLDAERHRSSRSPTSRSSCSIRSSTSRPRSACRIPRRRAARSPTSAPDSPTAPSEDFFEDFFDDEPRRRGRIRAWCSRSAPASSSMPSGLIVTNNHVIADADEIIANFADGTQAHGGGRRRRRQDRPGAAQGRAADAARRRRSSGAPTSCASATGCSPSATPSASAAR